MRPGGARKINALAAAVARVLRTANAKNAAAGMTPAAANFVQLIRG